ncbi:hypothetical protein L21SP2_3117 [Salinispira pacifica]|uniref:Uncharacterized protein n=1 Tax=Salinispira pacifica TaxID=1307761 RepID=V5WLH7_9SPIO|nr:hypothetical protein L21SP2_3117 [Salinispira pacifica]
MHPRQATGRIRTNRIARPGRDAALVGFFGTCSGMQPQ